MDNQTARQDTIRFWIAVALIVAGQFMAVVISWAACPMLGASVCNQLNPLSFWGGEALTLGGLFYMLANN